MDHIKAKPTPLRKGKGTGEGAGWGGVGAGGLRDLPTYHTVVSRTSVL